MYIYIYKYATKQIKQGLAVPKSTLGPYIGVLEWCEWSRAEFPDVSRFPTVPEPRWSCLLEVDLSMLHIVLHQTIPGIAAPKSKPGIQKPHDLESGSYIEKTSVTYICASISVIQCR